MRRPASLLCGLLLAVAAVAPCIAQTRVFSPSYELTRPVSSAAADGDLLPSGTALAVGPLRLAPAASGNTGAGLSLEAGKQQWFGRLTVGRTVELDMLSLGGGYRWSDGKSLSMQLTHSRQEGLGLSLRYDWPRSYYLRLSYDPRPANTASDMLRFSAGIRF
jgi:hypothetical protein